MKIALATACYKRPKVAERFLRSIQWPLVGAAVVAQPKELLERDLSNLSFPVWWFPADPMKVGEAKNLAADLAISAFNPDVLWVSDDDIIATQFTRLEPSIIEKLQAPDTGLIAITRQMGPQTNVEEIIPVDICYAGTGILVRADVWLEIGGFSTDANDEDDLSLRTYMAGYRNYRARNCSVIHNQGGRDGGGIAQALKDGHASFETTQYRDNTLLVGEIGPMRYKGIDTPWDHLRHSHFSKEARLIHKQNRKLKGFDEYND